MERVKFDERYEKEHWVYDDEFFLVHNFLMELLEKQTIPLKEIRFGFSWHYCKIDCKEGIKIFLRNIQKRMNNPKIVFQIKNFEIEAEQGAWDEITIKQKEIEVGANGCGIYFIFTKPIVRLFKNKLRIAKEKEVK